MINGLPIHHNIAMLGPVLSSELIKYKLARLNTTLLAHQKLGLPLGQEPQEMKDTRTNMTKCLARQMRTLIEPWSKVISHANTVGKDVPSLIGSLNVTLQVFDQVLTEDGANLPDTMSDFSHEKTFFIRYTQRFCAIPMTKQEAWKKLGTPESLPYHQAMLPLVNNARFAKAFGCSLGTRMNPVRKCLVI